MIVIKEWRCGGGLVPRPLGAPIRPAVALLFFDLPVPILAHFEAYLGLAVGFRGSPS